MAVIDFPANPTLNQVFVNAGVQWRWDSTKWEAFSSSTSITSVNAGHGLTGGGSSGAVFLALGVPVAVADGGTGSTTSSGALSNLGAAPATGGNYLPLSGGTISGGLTVTGNITANGEMSTYGRGVVYPNVGGNGFNFRWDGAHVLCRVDNSVEYPICNANGDTINGGLICNGAITANAGIAIYGGSFYNAFGNGWLYFSGSLQVYNFISSNDVNAYGRLIAPRLDIYGGVFYNGYNDGWLYFNGALRVNQFNCQAGASVDGYFTAGDFQSRGNVYIPNGSVIAGNDSTCSNVFRGRTQRGAKIECLGYDYDWVNPFIGGGTLYMTPDYSGGPYFFNSGWWSDARLKTNIRDSEVDALAAIMATPVRAFEYTEFGQSLQPWVKETGAKLGLVAQELQPNIPLAVVESVWEHKSLMINLNFVTPYLFRAVQQLAELLEEATKRIQILEDRV